MQLKQLGQAIKPLTLAAGMALSAPIMYADLDQYSAITSIISNHQTESYLKFVDNPEDRYQRLHGRFNILYQTWRDKTAVLSSPKSIVDNAEFRGIVSMGFDAVPFIIDAIAEEPSQLVWALNFIYGAKISNNKNLTISEACKLWVRKIRS